MKGKHARGHGSDRYGLCLGGRRCGGTGLGQRRLILAEVGARAVFGVWLSLAWEFPAYFLAIAVFAGADSAMRMGGYVRVALLKWGAVPTRQPRDGFGSVRGWHLWGRVCRGRAHPVRLAELRAREHLADHRRDAAGDPEADAPEDEAGPEAFFVQQTPMPALIVITILVVLALVPGTGARLRLALDPMGISGRAIFKAMPVEAVLVAVFRPDGLDDAAAQCASGS